MPEEAQKPDGAEVGAGVCVGTTDGTGRGVEELIAVGGAEGAAACPSQAINITGSSTSNNIRNDFKGFNRTSFGNASTAGYATGRHHDFIEIRLQAKVGTRRESWNDT